MRACVCVCVLVGAPLQAKAVKTYRESEGGTYKKLLPAEVGWRSGRRHDKPAFWLGLSGL